MAPDSPSDDELMLQVKDGNKAAFAVLFRRHSALVFGACMRIFSGNTSKAEDASQETWKRVVIYARSYEPKGAFRPWLWQVARNASLRELSKGRELLSSLPEGGDEPADEFDLEASLIEKHEVASVRAAIDGLPDAQRAALMCWVSGEHSYGEIAKQLGCSEGAVKQLLFRARQGLTKRLEEAG